MPRIIDLKPTSIFKHLSIFIFKVKSTKIPSMKTLISQRPPCLLSLWSTPTPSLVTMPPSTAASEEILRYCVLLSTHLNLRIDFKTSLLYLPCYNGK